MAQVSIPTLYSTLIAYQRSAALKAAIDLDVFTAVAEGHDTAAALARCRAASERGMRILCDAMVVLGFLAKQDSRYALAPGAELFLDRRSPHYAASAASFITSPLLVDHFMTATEAVRRGGTVIPGEGTLAPENPIWVEFARAMGPLAAFQAQMLADLLDADAAPGRVLDVAAGHGEFGIAFARRNPNTTVVALDWPNVLTVAEDNARKAAVIDRFETLPGSALEVEFGAGYDLVLLTNILHHFDPEGCERILRKAYAALEPGGKAVVLEFIPNEDRVSPPEAACFSLVMLVTTPSGDAYTFSELDRMFRNVGFAKNELHDLPPTFHRVVVSTK